MNPESNTQNSTVGMQDHGASSSATAKPNGARSNVAQEFHNFLSDIEDLIKATTSLTGEELTRAKAKLNERVAMAKGSVEDMSDTIAVQVRKTAASTSDYVHAEPWKAIGAGAALAFLLGIVLARRN